MKEQLTRLHTQNQQLRQLNLALNQAIEHERLIHTRALCRKQRQMTQLETRMAQLYELDREDRPIEDTEERATQCNSLNIEFKRKLMRLLTDLRDEEMSESAREKVIVFVRGMVEDSSSIAAEPGEQPSFSIGGNRISQISQSQSTP